MKTFLDYVNEIGREYTDFKLTTTDNNFKGSPYAHMEVHKNYNGSGPSAFGGAKEWGHITLRIGSNVNLPEKDGKAIISDLIDVLVKHGYLLYKEY